MYTVLVAESNYGHDGISQTLSRYFSKECTVYTAANSRDFFHCISRHNADIMFLDMEMPGISHIDMFRFLQKEAHPLILLPIIDLNSFDPSHFENAACVPDYLIKPFSETELILTMEEALQHCRRVSASSSDPAPVLNPAEISREKLFKLKLERYIADHYSDIFSMQEVAHAMNYSDTHFCRLFKQCFQVNFTVYMNEYRVDQAKKMLHSADISIKDVGAACGYRDTSYFIRVFKRHTGMTPSDYRLLKIFNDGKKVQ